MEKLLQKINGKIITKNKIFRRRKWKIILSVYNINMLSSKFKKGGVSLENSHKTYQPINLANMQNYINNAIDIYILKRYNDYGTMKHEYANVGKIAYTLTLDNKNYIMCKNHYQLLTEIN